MRFPASFDVLDMGRLPPLISQTHAPHTALSHIDFFETIDFDDEVIPLNIVHAPNAALSFSAII